MYLIWCIFWIKISFRPLTDKLARKREWCQDCWIPPLLALVHIALSAGFVHVLLWQCPSVNETEIGKAIALSFDQYAWWATPAFILVYQLVWLPYRVGREARQIWPGTPQYYQLPLEFQPGVPGADDGQMEDCQRPPRRTVRRLYNRR